MLLFISISIIATSLFATCYKVAVNRNCNLQVVNAWVYVGSAATIVTYMLLKGHPAFNLEAALLGGVTGIMTFFATLTFFLHMQKGQLSASWTVISLALAFPVMASVLIWHEHPTIRQSAALVIIAFALILFGRKELKNGGESK